MEDFVYDQHCLVPDAEKYERLVHLDLKGAPPKMSYLMQLLPTLKEWGATGLLMEYEDTFPYTDSLEVLQKQEEAYSKSEIADFQRLAKQLNLEYIPLIQIFGHFEFVLKHPQFASICEDPLQPSALCPSNEDSIVVIKMMVDQMIALHPDLKFFHIGADEVMTLGVCPRCQEKMKSQNWSHADLYLNHVVRVAGYIKEQYPGMRLIIWDDMLRKIDSIKMNEFNLSSYVEPMLWIYGSAVEYFSENLTPLVWKAYSETFSKFWIASAFKGAFGPDLYYVLIGHHIINHINWLWVLSSSVPQSLQLQGIACTGWQRYVHQMSLCELLPAGLPSLAFCLATILHGSFSQETHLKLSKQMGCNEGVQIFMKLGEKIKRSKLDVKEAMQSFPGQDVFLLVEKLAEIEYSEEGQLAVREGKSKEILKQALEDLKPIAQQVLSEVYHQSTVNEWIALRLDSLTTLIEAKPLVDT